MLHEKGKQLITDLEILGVEFDWTESEEHPGSPELQPKTQKDHDSIITHLENKSKEDPHFYSLELSAGMILIRCLKCKTVQTLNTYNQDELNERLITASDEECAECFNAGLEILSYISFEHDEDSDGWVMYEA